MNFATINLRKLTATKKWTEILVKKTFLKKIPA